jgi:hypothetical protein
MEGMRGVCGLLLVAFAAGCGHMLRVAWPGNHAGVGFFELPFMVRAAVTGGAGQLMGRVELDGVVTSRTPDLCRRYARGLLRRLGFRRITPLGSATAQQQKNYEDRGERAIHNLDTVP